MTQDNIDWELTIKKDGRTVTDGWVVAQGLGEAPTAQQIQEAEDLLAMADRL